MSFQNKALECREKVKYLGVRFEESMCWNEQVKSVRKKAYHIVFTKSIRYLIYLIYILKNYF